MARRPPETEKYRLSNEVEQKLNQILSELDELKKRPPEPKKRKSAGQMIVAIIGSILVGMAGNYAYESSKGISLPTNETEPAKVIWQYPHAHKSHIGH